MANEKGIALVLSLFLLSAMSVIAASLMFLSQTETYSSMNYRLMSQARYGAESGIQKAANHLLYTYIAPATAGADPIANYNTNVSPVRCTAGCPSNGQPVVLSANAAVPWNYPNPAVQAAFQGAFLGAQGTLPAGNTTVAFAPYATLVSMQQIEVYGGGIQTIQTWQLTSTGTITAGKTAQVEVSATLETPKFPAQMYAAFGTNPGCGTLNFHGKQTQTDSYDSLAALVGGNPVMSNSGGNVGTNGNLTEGGGADIYGTLSTPRVGVGACSDGNVNALSSSGGATVNGHDPLQPGDIVQLPQAVVLPAPTVPAGVPTTAYDGNGQTLLNGASVGNVTVNAGSTLTLGAPGVTSVININSIKINGNATVVILGRVVLNVVGSGETTPIDFTGGSVSNQNAIDPVTHLPVWTYDPSTFQVEYAGSGAVKLNGGAHMVGMVYAPNAATSLNGGGDFYGSVVGSTIDDTGGAKIHYDRRLSSEFFVVGNAMMSSFSWKKY
jgi:Tfp pilus assembly protein PilX